MLCGVSGGGNLTTGATYLARDEKLQPPLTGSILMCTGMPHESADSHGNHIDLYPGKCPSWQEHADAPISSRETNACYRGMSTISLFALLIVQTSPTPTSCHHSSRHSIRTTIPVFHLFIIKYLVSTHGGIVLFSTLNYLDKLVSKQRSIYLLECLTVGGQFIHSFPSTGNGFEIPSMVQHGC